MRAKAAINGTKNFQNAVTSFSYLTKYLITSCMLISVLMMSSGVSLENAVLLSFAIIAQWIPGALLWAWVKKDSKISPTELVGMGLAIGTLLALLSSQLFRTTPLGISGWIVPFLMSMPFIAWSSFRSSGLNSYQALNPNFKQLARTFLPAIGLGVIQLSVWWRWHPLKWSGWWKYNVDVPYFESYSNSLAILGTTHSLMDPTLDTRYHWFAYAWVGSLTNSLDIESFVVLTRLLPIVAMTMGATIAYSWAQSMSRKNWIPGLAALIVVIGPGLSIGSFVMLRSPSSAMSAGWSLAFSLLLFEIIKGQAKRLVSYLILILLSVGLVGGKATNTVLVGFAILALLLASFTQSTEIRNRIWKSGITSLIPLALTFELLIASSEVRNLDFGLFLGWPGLFLTILPMSIGICGLYSRKSSICEPLLVYSIGIALAGSLMSLFTYDPSGNQIYFLLSAATILVIPSLVGLEKLLYSEKRADLLVLVHQTGRRAKLYLGTNVILGGVVASLLWMLFENSASNTGKYGRTLAPIPLWIFSFLASLLLAKGAKPLFKIVRSQVVLMLVAIMLAALVSSGSTILGSIYKGPIYSGSSGIAGFGKSTKSNPGSISYNYVLAGEWTRRNTPSGDVFFSNRQCSDIESTLQSCDGQWVYASALSKRQFIVEGAAYSKTTKAETLTRVENQRISIRFSLNPNEKDWRRLWVRNVRWGWIDRNVSRQTDWGKFAQEVFSNSDVTVIKLLEPEG